MVAAGAARLGLYPYFSRKPTPFSPPRPRNPIPKSNARRLHARPISSSLVKQEQQLSFTEPEASLVEALLGIQGRGRSVSPQQLKDVERAVQALEQLGGVPEPTTTSLLEGRWQLIFTTRPGTASPIQRTFVGVDFFTIFQEVYLGTSDPRVSNIVKFSDAIGELKVEAAATVQDGRRILFQFDRAAFSFKFLPFKVPYPVPFRLLGDEVKGWLDTTYLSHTGNIRISRGSKGTTFVLQKETEPRQRLLAAISVGTGIMEAIDELVSLYHTEVKETETLEGEWQLLWTSQSDESWSAIASSGLKGLQIIKKNGLVENMVEMFPGFQLYASGNLITQQLDHEMLALIAGEGTKNLVGCSDSPMADCSDVWTLNKVSDSNKYNVTMNNGAVLIGTFKFPLGIRSKLDIELLYIDRKIKISRGDKGIIFIHLRLGRHEAK